MDKVTASEQLLNGICNIDNVVKVAMEDNELKNHVITKLSKGFENIVKDFSYLVEDIIKRIVNYHSTKNSSIKITDFIHLVDWYDMSLKEHPAEYWDTNGKYYGLRMNEVITMFLIARVNFKLV